MIAGTPFTMATFEHAWAQFKVRAQRWIDDDAIQAAKRDVACTLVTDDSIVVVSLMWRDNALTAFVLIAAGKPGAIKKHTEAIANIARDIGARKMAFRSDRRGWSRILGPEWKRSGDLYERGL